MDVQDIKLTQLIEDIEKVRRRKVIDYTSKDDIQYLDPFNNLGKIKISNNHLILGRRGSGKTTLLLSTIKEDNLNFLLPLDCQIFREWKANKIILSILSKITEKLKLHILNSDDCKTAEKGKPNIFVRGYKQLFGDSTISKIDEYSFLIGTLKKLDHLLNAIDELPIEPIVINVTSNKKNTEATKIISSAEAKAIAKLNLKGKIPVNLINLDGSLESTITASKTYSEVTQTNRTTNETFEFKKIISQQEKIEELILVFADIFNEFTRLSKNKAVLYLDDFYLVSWEAQPEVIQYFHDIYKNSSGNSFCFKICSLPNRTKLNKDGKVDFSIKDDFSPIRLDKELYDFSNLIEFLLRITANLNPKLGFTPTEIRSLFSNEEVLHFTTVATGGVPRDFLVILSEIIKIARSESSPVIRKEHLYSAISDLRQDKDQNIEIECDILPEKLRRALEIIQNEVIDGLKTNVILYPSKIVKEHEQVLKNLVNLRYLHIINDNTSSERVKKEAFTSYLVDMTFYATGKRLKQNFDFRQFWVQDSGHRHTQLRSAPIWNFEDGFIKS